MEQKTARVENVLLLSCRKLQHTKKILNHRSFHLKKNS